MSVALGTRNGADYLGAQLASIMEQTVPVDEIVLSDDASTDGTVELAESIVSRHRAGGGSMVLHVIRNDIPLGVTANFQQALEAADGEYLVLSDQDDVWRADRIEKALAEFDGSPDALLVASDAALIDADGRELGHRLFDVLGIDAALVERLGGPGAFDALLRRNLLTGATIMLRRSLLERAVPFPSAWVHDEWLALVASVPAGIRIVPEPLIGYRQHGANQIGVVRVDMHARMRRLSAPRTDRNARLLTRAESLVQRMPELDATIEQRSSAREKLRHEQVRSALPRARLRRVGPVLREWRTGRYGLFGRGAQDVLRDLVQPV